MKALKNFFRIQIPDKPVLVKPGIYHFRKEAGGRITRFHLRVESDGSGVLLANASVAARLSPTGVLIAKSRLEGLSYPVISRNMKENFSGASERQVESDVRKISQLIGELSNLEDNYPIFNLDDPSIVTPRHLIAPFHAQMKVAQPEQNNPILEKLWANGIMHVTFTAGENADEAAAVRNVERAEDLGMISGMRASSIWFVSPDRFQKLALAGVDYVVVPVISADLQTQDAFFGESNSGSMNECFALCAKWEVTPVLEVPIIRRNMDEMELILNEFSAKGVQDVLYYAVTNEFQAEGLSGPEIIRCAAAVEEMAHRSKVRYVWLPAISASGDLRSIVMDGPRSAGDVSIGVDPDGSVYAPRGPRVAAGNILQEPFQDIWNRDVLRRYRERIESPTRCGICPELEVCGADCPGEPSAWMRGDVQ